MSDQLFEIKLSLRAGPRQIQRLELFKAVLRQNGWREQDIMEWRKGVRAGLGIYTSTSDETRRVLKIIQLMRLAAGSVSVRKLKKKDWQDKWKKHIRPFALTNKLYVVPLWWKGACPRFQRREPIYLDTTLAFGTGLHETTRFLAQMIEDRGGAFSTFLDVGTGSGLLSIVARHSGARSVSAVDIDEGAVAVAQNNLSLNGMAFDLIAVGDFVRGHWKERFDFVAANLTSVDLLNNRKTLTSLVRCGKYLAVSGIDLKNLDQVREGFRECSLRTEMIRKGKRWAAVLFRRK